MEDDQMYPQTEDRSEDQKEETSEGVTALVPLDFLPESAKKVGTILKVKIVHLYEDEAEISIESETVDEKPKRMSAEEDLASMYS